MCANKNIDMYLWMSGSLVNHHCFCYWCLLISTWAWLPSQIPGICPCRARLLPTTRRSQKQKLQHKQSAGFRNLPSMAWVCRRMMKRDVLCLEITLCTLRSEIHMCFLYYSCELLLGLGPVLVGSDTLYSDSTSAQKRQFTGWASRRLVLTGMHGRGAT